MKKLFITLGIIGVSLLTSAKPAYQGGMLIQMEDGQQVMAYQHGDEYGHYTTLADGTWVKQCSNGTWKVTQALTEEQIQAKRAQHPRRIAQQTNTASPLNIAPKGLVIMVNFKDKMFKMTQAEMDSMINGVNYKREYKYKSDTIRSRGSARQYFIDQSYGQYQPVFDVVGPFNLPKKMAYYGENSWYGTDSYPEEMVETACEYARDSAHVDFSQYDNDNDGIVDFVYVFYAGYGEADGGGDNTIWPHSYDIAYDWGYTETFNGKSLGKYACSNEINYLSKEHDGIGTFVHEFSHVLGLPDLYATNNSTHKTTGAWDVMDYGPYNNDSNTPPAYSAYERFFMGWLTPTLLTDSATVTLRTTGDSAALIVTQSGTHNLVGNDPTPKKFYLVENRQNKGWDEYLPGHGLLITKIQYDYSDWTNNSVNDYKSSMGVDIIEADGKAPSYSQSGRTNGYLGKQGDCFPYDTIDYYTKDAFSTYTLTNIQEVEEDIILDFMGGGYTLIFGNEPKPESMDALIEVAMPMDNRCRKIFYQGNIYILRDDHIYTLQGQQKQ